MSVAVESVQRACDEGGGGIWRPLAGYMGPGKVSIEGSYDSKERSELGFAKAFERPRNKR
jgi:hypothetical protein